MFSLSRSTIALMVLGLIVLTTAAPRHQPETLQQNQQQQNQNFQQNLQYHQDQHYLQNQQYQQSNQNQQFQQNEHADKETTTPVPIVSFLDKHGPDGSFNYSYESGNGIKNQQVGVLKTIVLPRYKGDGLPDDAPPRETKILVQTGAYSYMAPDGSIISLSYTADENGFQPVGDHLPTTPPVPAAIQRLLQQQSPKGEAQPSTHTTNLNNLNRDSVPEGLNSQQVTTQNKPSENSVSHSVNQPPSNQAVNLLSQLSTLSVDQSSTQLFHLPSTSQVQEATGTEFLQTSTVATNKDDKLPVSPLVTSQLAEQSGPSKSVSQTLAETGVPTTDGPAPNIEVL